MFPISDGSKSSTSFETKDIESKKMEGVARNVLDDSHSNEHVSIAPKLKAPSVRKRTRIMIVPPSEAIKAANMRQKLTGDRDTESDLKSHINRKRTRRMTETSTKADQTTHTNLQTSKDEIKTDESISDGRTRSVWERTRTRIETSKEADMATHTKPTKSSEDEITMHFTKGKTKKWFSKENGM